MNNKTEYITRNILRNVTTNKDSFTWKELNCNYRPWAVAFKGINEENYDAFLLLVSYIESYIGVNKYEEMYEFLTLYEDYLEDYFNAKIEKSEFINKYDMVNRIKENIDNDKLIVLPGDIYELFYNPMYKVEHYHHLFIVKGYDINKDLIYLLDNIHIDCGASTDLTDFMIKIDELFEIAKSYCNEYENKVKPYFYSIKKDNKLMESPLKKLEKLIKNTNRIYWEKEAYESTKNDKNKFNIRKIYANINFKNVFFVTLKQYLKDCNIDNIIIDNFYNKYLSIKNRWSNLLIKVLYIKSKNEKISEEFDKMVESYILEEEKLISEIENMLKSIEINSIKNNIERCGLFKILNRNKAKIVKEKDKYLMNLSNSKTYDTWLAEDNAAQLLLENTVNNLEFSVTVKTYSKVGEDHHSGIIIKMKDGIKYLFGIYRNEGIGIFCPNIEKNNELYNLKQFGFSEYKIKVMVKNSKIFFYIVKPESGNEFQNVYSIDINSEVNEIGLFAKTWVKVNHSVEFNNVSYKELK